MPVPEKDIRGPSHSSYSKVVVPSKVTVVPSVRSVKSRVVPAGTVMPERTMLVQSALPARAASASVKVQAEDAPTGATSTVPLVLLLLLLPEEAVPVLRGAVETAVPVATTLSVKLVISSVQ